MTVSATALGSAVAASTQVRQPQTRNAGSRSTAAPRDPTWREKHDCQRQSGPTQLDASFSRAITEESPKNLPNTLPTA